MTNELAFPNSILALFGWPDKEVRELCFRIYNEHIAEVQERSGNRIYGVGLINWWDAEGARRTLAELKELGLKTFLMPLSPGKDEDGKPIDFASSAMDGVWAAIEEGQVPVSHHIGESPPSSPTSSTPSFSACCSRWPRSGTSSASTCSVASSTATPACSIGWFEGGINWVPSAIQDAQHISASFKHIANLEIKHDPQHYWDHHMCASFMLDPLGLDLVDRIGVDKVMWSTDFPHNESTYGYSNESLESVVTRSAWRRPRRSSATTSSASSVSRLMPAGLMANAPPARIPATPEFARMRRDRVRGCGR